MKLIGMKKNDRKFEHLCTMMLEGKLDRGALIGMPVEIENLFYENFGMSSEEIYEVFTGSEGV